MTVHLLFVGKTPKKNLSRQDKAHRGEVYLSCPNSLHHSILNVTIVSYHVAIYLVILASNTYRI